MRLSHRSHDDDSGKTREQRQALPPLSVTTLRVALSAPGEATLYETASGMAYDPSYRHKGDEEEGGDDEKCDEGGDEKDDEKDDEKGDDEGGGEESSAAPEDRNTIPGTGKNRAREFERILRCRQAATHPAIYQRSMARKTGDEGRNRLADALAAAPAPEVSSKMARLARDVVENARDERSVVFCDWSEEMLLVESELIRVGVPPTDVHAFHGGLAVDERDRVLEAFREGGPGSVLLAQIRCAGVGLNLQCASRAYLMRPQWNPAVERQAIGRLHRSGQQRPVTVVRLIAAGTIDEACLWRQARKLECVRRIMVDKK